MFYCLSKSLILLISKSLNYLSFVRSLFSEAREKEKEDQADKEFRSPASASSATGAGSAITERYLDMVGDYM